MEKRQASDLAVWHGRAGSADKKGGERLVVAQKEEIDLNKAWEGEGEGLDRRA